MINVQLKGGNNETKDNSAGAEFVAFRVFPTILSREKPQR
jgi:hypothetical protein